MKLLKQMLQEPKVLLLLRFIKNRNALILMGLADISAGILLIVNRKAGWVIAMIALLIEMLVPLKFLFLGNKSITQSIDVVESHILDAVIWFFFFGTLMVIMHLKPFRLKYPSTIKTYSIILCVSGFILIDYIFLFK